MHGWIRLTIVVCLCLGAAEPWAGEADLLTVEDYALYDQVVTKKFLTSDTQLVVIERTTVARVMPTEDEPLTVQRIQAQGFFDGLLPPELIGDFVAANRLPGRLEGRFGFEARYRFVSGNVLEEPEVSRAIPVQAVQSTVLDRLAFSRVGRTLRNDQALVYVENLRPDGTGAGFLVWFRRQGRDWRLYDTEVVWTVRPDSGESPLLAP